MTRLEGVETTTQEIGQWFRVMLDDLSQLAEDSAIAMGLARGKRAALSARDLKSAGPAAERFLVKHPEHEAAGIILRPGVVGPEGEIEWWKRDVDGSFRTILFSLTPHTAGFYDFETLEWFSNVVNTGRPTITGPYVDYAGMDKYILTTTVPLRDGDQIIGAAGSDIEMRTLEPALMPLLRRIDADAAIVSQHDRIVLGNSGRFLVGNRLGTLPAGSEIVDLEVHELGLRLVASPRSSR